MRWLLVIAVLAAVAVVTVKLLTPTLTPTPVAAPLGVQTHPTVAVVTSQQPASVSTTLSPTRLVSTGSDSADDGRHAEQEQARMVAEQFAAVYARPEPDQADQWADQVSAWVTDSVRADLAQMVPELVPYTQVAGPAVLVGRGPAPSMFRFQIPTDGPDLAVTVGPDEADPSGWLIWGIDLGGGQQ